ncbi:MAG: hypothetical protein K2X46_17835 [Roseomonas sp.]|nr:hypothetical protein [Roseomonas sp.]
MKIECILLRDGGTHAEVGGVRYHFRPSPEHGGAHVAEVDDSDHAARFLSIREGYRALALADAPVPAHAEPTTIDASAESDRLAAEANAAVQAEREAHLAAQDAAAEEAAKAAIAAAPNLDGMTREQMVALHEERFGRKPHHRLSDDKLREALALPPAAD